MSDKTDEGVSYFGAYNHIYFMRSEGALKAVCDRGRRLNPLTFSEHPLEDLLGPSARESSTMRLEFTSGLTSDSKRTIEIAGHTFEVEEGGSSVQSGGFSRSLTCHVLERGPERSATLLAVELPTHARYRVTLEPQSANGATIELSPNMRVSILTDTRWHMDGDTAIFETGDEQASVGFLFESESAPMGGVTIVAEVGFEHTAILACAACGIGFTPCFVLDPADPLENIRLKKILTESSAQTFIWLGSSEPPPVFPLGGHLMLEARTLLESGSSRHLTQLLNGDRPRSTVLAPRLDEACGPALYLAFKYGTLLDWSNSDERVCELRNPDGRPIGCWSIDDLLEEVLDPLSVDCPLVLDGVHDEVVVAQNTLRDLLVAQAVGYAALRGSRLVLLNDSRFDEAPGFPFDTENCAAAAARAVPPSIRALKTQSLAIFTSSLPLHLTPCGPNSTWRDIHDISHLLGAHASILVPRFLGSTIHPVPDLSFSIVFDALGDAVDTETEQFVQALSNVTSSPLVLAPPDSRASVLPIVLQILAADVLLLVAHGDQTGMEDCIGTKIPTSDIEQWDLKNSPVVLNNSCSNLTATSRSFILAGARAVVATLWPVDSRVAAQVAARIAAGVVSGHNTSLSTILRLATQSSPLEEPDPTHNAYIYLGLPGHQSVARPPLDDREVVDAIGRTLKSAYRVARDLATEGLTGPAFAIRNAVIGALRRRVSKLINPGEMPLSLPHPMARYSLLEIDLLIALMDIELARSAVTVIPQEGQPGLLNWMEQRLQCACDELWHWEDRHDQHLGRTKAERLEIGAKLGGIHIGSFSDADFLREASSMARGAILPFAVLLARHGRLEDAKHWFSYAAMSVTTPSDLNADRSVDDDVLARRLKQGIQQTFRVVWSRDGSGPPSLELLGTPAERAQLANRFGTVCNALQEFERAALFFEAALDIAAPGTEEYANADANLATARRSSGTSSGASHLDVFQNQELQGDNRNALITLANFLRYNSAADTSIGFNPIERARTLAAQLPEPERTRRTCDILGAAACWAARNGQHSRAIEYVDEIRNYISMGARTPEVVGGFINLSIFYSMEGYHSRALDLLKEQGPWLAQMRLPDAALRARLIAAQTALKAYESHKMECHLIRFLEESQEVANIMNTELDVDPVSSDVLDPIRDNCPLVWQQADVQGRVELALAAYNAMRAWTPHRSDETWELLRSAMHPKNLERLRAESAKGLLHRTVFVTMNSQGGLTSEVITEWLGGAEVGGTLFSFLPVELDVTCHGATLAAKRALYVLEPSRPVKLHLEHTKRVMTEDQSFVHQDVWGSRTFIYSVQFRLAPTLVPIQIALRRRTVAAPSVLVQSTDQGLVLHLRPSLSPNASSAEDGRWLADFGLRCVRHEPLAQFLLLKMARHQQQMPWSVYKFLVDSLIRHGE